MVLHRIRRIESHSPDNHYGLIENDELQRESSWPRTGAFAFKAHSTRDNAPQISL